MEELRANPAREMLRTGLFWTGVITLAAILDLTVSAPSARLDVLRGILLLAAAGEALGGALGVFRPRWFNERNGRPYSAAYHGVVQDFGFYNLAFALLFAIAAVDPVRRAIVIAVAIALYAVHGLTHVLRCLGLYYGGGAPIPTRPRHFELRDGLMLLAPAVGMILFFP
jgi:hypothetical protein